MLNMPLDSSHRDFDIPRPLGSPWILPQSPFMLGIQYQAAESLALFKPQADCLPTLIPRKEGLPLDKDRFNPGFAFHVRTQRIVLLSRCWYSQHNLSPMDAFCLELFSLLSTRLTSTHYGHDPLPGLSSLEELDTRTCTTLMHPSILRTTRNQPRTWQDSARLAIDHGL